MFLQDEEVMITNFTNILVVWTYWT